MLYDAGRVKIYFRFPFNLNITVANDLVTLTHFTFARCPSIRYCSSA